MIRSLLLGFVLLVVFLLLSGGVQAGSADAIITGKTSSGRTELEVAVQDITNQFRWAKLTIDGESMEFRFDEADDMRSTVIRDVENGFYFLMMECEEKVFRLWMVPGSETVLVNTSGSYRSRFAAVIEATDPRKNGKWALTPRITIGCVMVYSV